MSFLNLKTVLASAALSTTLMIGSAHAHHGEHTIQNVFDNINNAGELNADELEELVREFASLDVSDAGNFYMSNHMLKQILDQNQEDIGALFETMNHVYDNATEDYTQAFALSYMINGLDENLTKKDDLWEVVIAATNDGGPHVKSAAYAALAILAVDNDERTKFAFNVLSDALKDYDATKGVRSIAALALAMIGRDEAYSDQVWNLLLEQLDRDITFNNEKPYLEYDNKDLVLNSIARMGTQHENLRSDAWDILTNDLGNDNPSVETLKGMSLIARVDPYYALRVIHGDEVSELLSHDDFRVAAAATATLFEAAYSTQWIAENHLFEVVDIIEREFFEADHFTNESEEAVYEHYKSGMQQRMNDAIQRIDQEWGIRANNQRTHDLNAPN